jgi:hypothetical protein
VTVEVRDTTAPTVTVAAPADVGVSPGSGPINYSDKVGAAIPPPPPLPHQPCNQGARAARGGAARWARQRGCGAWPLAVTPRSPPPHLNSARPLTWRRRSPSPTTRPRGGLWARRPSWLARPPR